jgi:cell division protease FtsH
MLMKYGMDDDLGLVMYAEKDADEYKMLKKYSERTAQIIDEKVIAYTMECYERAKKIIQQNKALIERMSVVLLDKEYLTKEEFEAMMGKLLPK